MSDIKAETRRVAKVLSTLENDRIELEKARTHLSKRRDHLNKLLSGDQYDHKAIREQLKMLPTEERRVDDMLSHNEQQRRHYGEILIYLTEKLNIEGS